jgi:PPOX class probable F420-dependent enzyme
MPDYGVPTELDGTLPWSWAEERLVANRNYWVVTASAEGRPHSLPVWGVWTPDDERFWFSCAPSSRKARNVAENAWVVVTVDDTVECVSVEGRARVVVGADMDEPAAVRAVDAYVEKYWPDPADQDESREFVRRNLLVEVVPDRAFGIIEREDEFAARATRWKF